MKIIAQPVKFLKKQGRRTKRSRSQKIFNIKASGASGTALNARIIYKNLSLFLNRLDKSTVSGSAATQFIKIISKVGCKTGDKTRFISISTFSYLDLNNKTDLTNYINLCVNNFLAPP